MGLEDNVWYQSVEEIIEDNMKCKNYLEMMELTQNSEEGNTVWLTAYISNKTIANLFISYEVSYCDVILLSFLMNLHTCILVP